MEILNPIKELVNKLDELGQEFDSTLTLSPIITHIERAEHFFSLGKEKNDEHYYTDVIYRTNQAFEGCSRQAYMVLAEKNEAQAQRLKAYQIEEYFANEGVLSDRVLPQFQTYRDSWRNESAHNFKLFFDESEAYFAILNVSSYAYVLFNQMITKLAYKIEERTIKKEELKLKKMKGVIGTSKPLKDRIVKLIEFFDQEIDESDQRSGSAIKLFSEVQILGMLTAYLQEASSEMKVELDKSIIVGKRKFRVDIYIELGDETTIIELKSKHGKGIPQGYKEQVLHYLKALSISDGILYIYPRFKRKNKIKREDLIIENEGKKYNLTLLGN